MKNLISKYGFNVLLLAGLLFATYQYGRLVRTWQIDNETDARHRAGWAVSSGWAPSSEYLGLKQRGEAILPGTEIATAQSMYGREMILTYEGVADDGAIRLKQYLDRLGRRMIKIGGVGTSVVHDPMDVKDNGALIIKVEQTDGRVSLDLKRRNNIATAQN